LRKVEQEVDEEMGREEKEKPDTNQLESEKARI